MFRIQHKYKIFILVGFLFLLVVSGTDKGPEFSSRQNDFQVMAPEIPTEFSFAGEKVPLFIPDVKERLDRELLINVFFHSNTFQLLKRANRWFPLIEPVLKENGIPDDFKYVALIESDFLLKVSPSGAAGYWQFLVSTGKKFGLEINDEIDERYHVQKATKAACSYLNMAEQLLGNWTLAAASYNMGIENTRQALKFQKVSNYYDLLLNQETSRYIFRIIAVKMIFENPQKYGFIYDKKQLYLPYRSHPVQTDTTISSLVDYAIANHITYKELKIYNPWLLKSELKNKARKVYVFDIPDSSYRAGALGN